MTRIFVSRYQDSESYSGSPGLDDVCMSKSDWLMRFLTLMMSFIFPLSAMSVEQTPLKTLEQLTWENRIILVFSARTDKYQQLLQQAKAEIDDRDIVWFIIDDQQITSNYRGNISDQLAANINSQFSSFDEPVILIGKDGGVKETSDLLSLESLFDEIDSMPMRIREMKDNS